MMKTISLSTIASSALGEFTDRAEDGACVADEADGEEEINVSLNSLNRRRTASAVAPEPVAAYGMTTLIFPTTVVKDQAFSRLLFTIVFSPSKLSVILSVVFVCCSRSMT